MNTFRRQLEHICQNVLLTIALFIPCLRIEFAWMEAYVVDLPWGWKETLQDSQRWKQILC